MDYSIFQNLLVALVLSILVGLEREHNYQINKFTSFGGVRTFALVGIIGFLAYFVSSFSLFFGVALTIGFFGLVIASYVMAMLSHKHIGGTSEMGAVLVYLIGFISGMGEYFLATAIALIVLAILHFKTVLHGWAKNIKDAEIIATIQFILIAFVILPILPNKSFGPYAFFNPYMIWLMIVLISGLSYLSYVAIRLFGEKRGIGVTGFLAGFISSTALVLSFSGQSKRNPNIVNPFVIAVVIASSAMFFRVLVEAFVVNRVLFDILLWPVLSMGIVGVICSLFFIFKKEVVATKVQKSVLTVKSPFNFFDALKFGLFFALVLFFSKFLNATMGANGVYLTSVFSGMLDVDAVTLSMANLSKNGLSVNVAAYAVFLATITNTLVKAGMFLVLGGRKAAVKILIVFALIILSGLTVAGIVY